MNRTDLAFCVVLEAGRCLTKMFDRPLAVQEKGYLDMVSEADKKAEKIIISAINSHFPGDGILSEESSESGTKTDYRWIVDPLDGTHNFLAGFKEFGTLLALEQSGKIIFGACYFPLINEFFAAYKGKGAFCNNKRITVSGLNKLRGGMFCSDGVMRHKPKEIISDIEKFCNAGCRLRVYGSSPYSLTRIALGQAAIATNRLCKPWDVAAPALIVEEAGGKVTNQFGNPWSVDSEMLIATNGLLHDEALRIFN